MSAPELRKADTGVYYVFWTEGRRSKRVSTRTKDLVAAKRFLGEWLLMDETRASSEFTCADLWAIYDTEHVEKRVVAPHKWRSAWLRLGPFFGKMKPRDVTQATVNAYAAHRQRVGNASSTVWLDINVLRTSWNYSVKTRRLASTELPAQIELPPPPMPRERWLKEHEFEALIVAVKKRAAGPRLSRLERFVWLAIETAGRRDALEKLTWGQVDFETRVIHLNPRGRRQTSKRRADVPISDALLPVLRRAYDERTGEFVLDTPGSSVKQLKAAADSVGLKGVTPHVFRHTAATWMARRGVPLWKIAKVLGNSMLMVERVYAKHCPDDLADAVNSISGPKLRVVR